MYSPAWKNKKSNKFEDENIENYDSDSETEGDNENFTDQDSKFNYVMQCFGPPHQNCKTRKTEKLPDYLKLVDVYPGEPPFMKKGNFQLF